VRIFDGVSWSTTSVPSFFINLVEPLCGPVALRSATDVWIKVFDPANHVDFGRPKACHYDGAVWACLAVDGQIDDSSLVLTPHRLWWTSAGRVFALDTGTAGASPTFVPSESFSYGSLQATDSSDAVLLVTGVDSPRTPELVTLDGTRTDYVVGPGHDEGNNYGDVWLGVGGVYALDVIYDCRPYCDWLGCYPNTCEDYAAAKSTKLVVYKLDSVAAPTELGHVTISGFVGRHVGVDRLGARYVAADAWYRVP
jgi:hypothetical protein